MKKNSSSQSAFTALLSVAILLSLNTLVQAQIETWSAPVAFTVKVTTHQKDSSGNKKLVTSTESFDGVIDLYYDTLNQMVVPSADGCVLELIGNTGSATLCFDAVTGPTSSNQKTRKGSTVFVGTGTVSDPVLGNGISYINGKGSYVSDSNGDPISIRVSGSLGGGFLSAPFIFTATLPNTNLTLISQPQ